MARPRPCLNCRTLTCNPHGRCGSCDSQRIRNRDRLRNRDANRSSPTERGYGADHRRLRKHWKPEVDTGTVNCARCHQPIQPNEPWDLGHNDNDRTKYNGPEHTDCNRRRRPRDKPAELPNRLSSTYQRHPPTGRPAAYTPTSTTSSTYTYSPTPGVFPPTH